MPLAFQSTSHGTIAFGFFNIEIDMLLLDRLFFLAGDFCAAVIGLARDGAAEIQGWRIEDPSRIGNLHGAIAGDDLSGFIGVGYERFPFPADPAGFKQSPEGSANNAWAAELIAGFGSAETIALRWDRQAGQVCIAELVFAEPGFGELVGYVDRGGYPRWRDGQRPAHVRAMMQSLLELGSVLAPRR